MRPDLEAIRARWAKRGHSFDDRDEFERGARTDIPALLAYVDDLEHERDGWKFNACDARDQIAILEGKHPVPAELWPRITYVVGQEETANRIAHAEARFVEEYDMRKAAERERDELRTELFDWQDAVGYVLGDNWSSEDEHDAKAARRALAEWAAKAQGEAPQLLAEIAELRAATRAMAEPLAWAHEFPPEYSKEYECWLCERCGRGRQGDESEAPDGWKKRPVRTCRPNGGWMTECDRCCDTYRESNDE